MGFTFAHPAAIIPAKYLPQHWYSVTGLVVGSIVPDFEYFFRLNHKSIYSHHPMGILWFDLPVGCLVAFIFHLIIKVPLFNQLPHRMQLKLASFIDFDWLVYVKNHWAIFIFSLIVGAGSHIVWDSFTSIDGYFVNKIPGLLVPMTQGDDAILWYKVLKHLSSVLGLFFILRFYASLPERPFSILNKNLPVFSRRLFWALVSLITVGFLSWRLSFHYAERPISLVVKIIISGILTSLLVVCFTDRLLFRLKN